MKARLIQSKAENRAKSIVTFWFEPEKPLDQLAGQYIELTLPVSSGSPRRWFTLSSSPTESPLVSITTRVNEPISPFKSQLLGLEPGALITLTGPLGDFVLPKDKSIPLVFIAGGIGITPFRSILKYLSDTNEKRQLSLIHLVKRREDLIFQPLLKQFSYRPILSADGRYPAETLLAPIEAAGKRALIYLAGPEVLVETLAQQMDSLGVKRTHLVLDLFLGYKV